MAKYDEFREAARPLVEYVRDHCTPETHVIVTGVGIDVLSTEKYLLFEDDLEPNDEV